MKGVESLCQRGDLGASVKTGNHEWHIYSMVVRVQNLDQIKDHTLLSDEVVQSLHSLRTLVWLKS